MLNKIVEALTGAAISPAGRVRHLRSRGAQVYAVPGQIESQRLVNVEQYRIDVLCQTSDPRENRLSEAAISLCCPARILRRRSKKPC